MTLKHRLSDRIFNASIAASKRLSTILTSLQTMASIFDEMELNKSNSRCVELTLAQYNMMYKARYNTTDLIRSLDDVTKHYLPPQK